MRFWGMEWRQVLKRFPPLLPGHDPETSRISRPSKDLQVMAGGLYRTTSMFIHTCCTWMQGCLNLELHQEQKRILCKIPCPWSITNFIFFTRIFTVLLLLAFTWWNTLHRPNNLKGKYTQKTAILSSPSVSRYWNVRNRFNTPFCSIDTPTQAAHYRSFFSPTVNWQFDNSWEKTHFV